MKEQYLLICLLVLFTGCNTNDKKDLERRLNQLESENTKLKDQIEDTQKTKYIYVKFKIEAPVLIHTDAFYSPISGRKEIEASDIISKKNYVLISGVEEIQNYNEDAKYRIMDEFENKVIQSELPKYDMEFTMEVYSKAQSSKHSDLLKNKTRILNRKPCVFDSYMEASEHRNNNQEVY